MTRKTFKLKPLALSEIGLTLALILLVVELFQGFANILLGFTIGDIVGLSVLYHIFVEYTPIRGIPT